MTLRIAAKLKFILEKIAYLVHAPIVLICLVMEANWKAIIANDA